MGEDVAGLLAAALRDGVGRAAVAASGAAALPARALRDWLASGEPLGVDDGHPWPEELDWPRRRADRAGWPAPDGAFDVAVAGSGADLGEAVRVLRVGGILLLAGEPPPGPPAEADLEPLARHGGLATFRRAGRRMPNSRGCVVCGSQNPIGLRLRFWQSGDRVWADGRPAAHFEGFEGVLHGGIVTALLDDALWYAVHAATGMIGMTAELQVRFRRPVRVGDAFTVAGRFQPPPDSPAARRPRRVADATARLYAPSGEVMAEASGRFLPGQQPLTWDDSPPP